MSKETEVLVIGAGPGGYVAAIRAAQLGKDVTLVEKEYIGGVCLNVGCIPSKAMITASHKYNSVEEYGNFGLDVPEINFDWTKVQDFRANTVDQLTSGIEMLLKGYEVDVVYGMAKFEDANTVTIENGDDDAPESIKFEDVIIATGSRPRDIPSVKFSDRIVSSTEVLEFAELPESLVVIGGGVIGIELATVYANFGTKVTILEGAKNILPTINRKATNVVLKNLKAKGVEVITNAMVQGAEDNGSEVTVTAEVKGEEQTFTADYVMLSIGRLPNTDKINLEAAGVEVNDHGIIEVDDQYRTNVSNIYAIGDIVPGPQLAHKASYEAKVAADAINGGDMVKDYYAMPSVVFSEPEIAVTGHDAASAKEAGLKAKAHSFNYGGNGRAIAMGETDGFVSIIAEQETGKVLGAEIVGANASDLINEITLAIESGLTVEDIALTIHPHPTLGEIVMEAAEVAIGMPIHTVVKKRKK